MAELSDKGRKVIDDAMANDEPPPVDDSWGTLVSRLTGEASRGALPIDEPVVAIAPASASDRRWIWIAIAIAAAVAGFVAWRWSVERPEPAAVATDAPARPTTIAVPAKAAKVVPEEPPLAQLLALAEAALAAGDPDRAMALLQRHAERGATDPSAPQRMALRVLVLCAQDKRELARDEAKAFLAAHGQSEWGEAVRRSCAGAE